MAAKRTASSDLNHDNWNEEEAPEEAGTFKRASEDKIKNRIIKTARRRNPISRASEDTDNNSKNLFSNITFSKNSTSSSTQAFSFLSNLSTQSTLSIPSGTQPLSPLQASSTSVKADSKSNHYLSKLKGLNEAVSKWIKQHVDDNPLVNLQPIFDEYKRYFEELDKEESSSEKSELDKKSDNDSAKKAATSENNLDAKSSAVFTFGQPTTTPSFNFSAPPTSKPFTFGANTASSSFKFTPYQSSGTSAPTNGFAFSAPALSVTSTSTETPVVNGENDEDDTPPKVEFTPVIEKDYIYTIRCKVFVKKDGQFGDRGVGNLFLKQIENSEKVQLIVRADTNLGNLLCNFILSESIPMQRMGKKDVMLVCLPTPDFKPPPVPILLRVKSPQEADTLLETLEKYKK